MKPRLVDLDEFFRMKNKSVVTKQKNIIKSNTNTNIEGFNYQSLFNMFGLIFITIGIFTLVKRKENKLKNKKDFEDKINNLPF